MAHKFLGSVFGVWLLVWGPGSVEADLVLGQLDDFEDSTMGWTGGSNPTLIVSGGPAGAGDGYLRITSRSDGRFGTQNGAARWSRDFSAASGIQMDVNNLGSIPIELRIMLVDRAENTGSFASTSAVTVPATSGWMNVLFSLDAADMTHVGGGSGSYAGTLGSVDTLLIHHDSGAPSGPETPPNLFGATLGMDNISAVPEPSSLLLMGLAGGLGLAIYNWYTTCASQTGRRAAKP